MADFFDYLIYTGIYGVFFYWFVNLFILKKLNVRKLDIVSHFKCILMSVQKVWRILAFLIFPIVILPMPLFVVFNYFPILFNFFY